MDREHWNWVCVTCRVCCATRMACSGFKSVDQATLLLLTMKWIAPFLAWTCSRVGGGSENFEAIAFGCSLLEGLMATHIDRK